MSSFDTVVAQCPICDSSVKWQSKGAARPKLRTFDRRWVPLDVAAGTDTSVQICKCGAALTLVPRTPNIEMVATVVDGGG